MIFDLAVQLLELVVDLALWFLSHADWEVWEDGKFQYLLLHGLVVLFEIVDCGGYESAVLGGEEGVLDLLLFVLLRYFFKNRSADRIILQNLLFLRIHTSFLLSLVYKHISIFNPLFLIVSTRLPSKRLIREILNIKIPNNSIIKFIPFGRNSILNERIVMPTICRSNMHNNSFQDIVVILYSFVLLIFYGFGIFLLAEVLTRVLLEVESVWEFAVIVEF